MLLFDQFCEFSRHLIDPVSLFDCINCYEGPVYQIFYTLHRLPWNMKLVSTYQNELFLVRTSFPTVLVCSLSPLHQLSQSHCHRCHHFQGMYLLTHTKCAICFNSSNFYRNFAKFPTGSTVQKGRNSSVWFGTTFDTSLSPFNLLKDISTKGVVSTCYSKHIIYLKRQLCSAPTV